MANCSSGCPTQDHATYGECLKSKNMKVGWANSANNVDRTADKQWESRLGEYYSARKQGIMPQSTKLRDIRQAVEISNETGKAFRADK